MDSEMWFEPYIDTYDRPAISSAPISTGWRTRDRPVPDAKVAIYPFKRSFVVGAVSTDVQSGLATMCYLPGMETPERECWYINMGAVDATSSPPKPCSAPPRSKPSTRSDQNGRGLSDRARSFLTSPVILRERTPAPAGR